jgi:hypothetical protein
MFMPHLSSKRHIPVSVVSLAIVIKPKAKEIVRTTAILHSAKKFIYISMALQLFVGPWPLFQFIDLFHSQ